MELWKHLAGTAAEFAPAISVAVSPRSYLCPPGWAGIVVIGDAALPTAPDHETSRLIEQALSGLPAASLTSTDVLSIRLPIAEIRGPAALAYLDPADFRPQPHAAATPLDLDHPHLRQFLLAADANDLEESGIQEITTPAFAIREHRQVAAAAGYRNWPCGIAHLSVLTASAARGRGLTPCRRVSSRRPRDRGRPAAAMAGTTPGLPARCPRPGIPRTGLASEHPPRRCSHFPPTLITTRAGKAQPEPANTCGHRIQAGVKSGCT
jgi:hypothetical protein